MLNKCSVCGEVIGFEKHVCKSPMLVEVPKKKKEILGRVLVDAGIKTAAEVLDDEEPLPDITEMGVVPNEVPSTAGMKTTLERWRTENREHYNAKQREYQKAYRARQKK